MIINSPNKIMKTWRDSSVVKGTCCFCIVPDPYVAGYRHLQLHLQGIWHPVWPSILLKKNIYYIKSYGQDKNLVKICIFNSKFRIKLTWPWLCLSSQSTKNCSQVGTARPPLGAEAGKTTTLFLQLVTWRTSNCILVHVFFSVRLWDYSHCLQEKAISW